MAGRQIVHDPGSEQWIERKRPGRLQRRLKMICSFVLKNGKARRFYHPGNKQVFRRILGQAS
jgi:hypothetical protein